MQWCWCRLSVLGAACTHPGLCRALPMAGTMPSLRSWLEQDISHHGWVSAYLLQRSDTFLGP